MDDRKTRTDGLRFRLWADGYEIQEWHMFLKISLHTLFFVRALIMLILYKNGFNIIL